MENALALSSNDTINSSHWIMCDPSLPHSPTQSHDKIVRKENIYKTKTKTKKRPYALESDLGSDSYSSLTGSVTLDSSLTLAELWFPHI